MNNKDFKENYYFELFKNKRISKKMLEIKLNCNCKDLYARILNYQIDVYGEPLINIKVGEEFKDNKKDANNAKARRNYRRSKDDRQKLKNFFKRNDGVI